MGRERTADYYDGIEEPLIMFENREKFYQNVCSMIPNGVKRIADLGCGTGSIAATLEKIGFPKEHYRGFDFSKIRIETARKRHPGWTFVIGDVFSDDIRGQFFGFDCFIIIELLEHVWEDRELLDSLPGGSHVILSVPNIDDSAHVRWFNNIHEVAARYDRLIDIQGGLMQNFINHDLKIFILSGKKRHQVKETSCKTLLTPHG